MAEPATRAQVSAPLLRTAMIVGGYRWIETRLFELTGRWAVDPALPDVPSLPAIRIHLDELRAQHAWHAREWGERLPLAHNVDHEALTAAPGPGARDVISALEEDDLVTAPRPGPGPDTDRDRLVRRMAGLHRVVLPRLIVSYERHRSVAAPVADKPIRRVLDLVLRDEVEACLAGEALLEELLATPEDVRAAARGTAHAESLIVRSGVRRGIVAWPETGSSGRNT
ncbi:MAG: hypothetical protein ACYDHU_02360 [Acidimicrobiales bacterium]